MKERLRKALEQPRARWLGPVAATALVGLLMLPDLIGSAHRESETTVVPPPPAQARPTPPLASETPPAPEGSPATESSGGAADEVTGLDLDSRFDCVIEPAETVELGSPVTGVIEAIHVERGDFVAAGEAVAELESEVERAAADVARARSRLQGSIKSREASYELGQRRNARVGQLFESQTLSADLRDQAQTEAKIAELELMEAKEQRRLATLELEQAMALLNRRTIHSPVSGVVVSRDMSAGEVVVDEKTILTIAQIDPLRVEVILPSALYGEVTRGMRAAVEPELGDEVHVASVQIVDQVIDAASGTFGVQLELPNPDHSIPGGLHCQVRFLGP